MKEQTQKKKLFCRLLGLGGETMFKTLKLELERHGSIFFAFVDVENETVRAVYDLDTGADVTELEKDAPDVLEAVRARA